MRATTRIVSRDMLALTVLLLALGLLGPDGAVAQSQSFPHGTVRLVAETSGVQTAHNFTLALHFSLEDGWHTYWVNPGDSGEPPRVTWALPAGITAGPIEWPVPEKLGTSSIVDYGYRREVTPLVPLHAAATLPAQEPLTIRAEVRLLHSWKDAGDADSAGWSTNPGPRPGATRSVCQRACAAAPSSSRKLDI
jgi:DsbC/DsbD-like thiol-disulfide interchange protein